MALVYWYGKVGREDGLQIVSFNHIYNVIGNTELSINLDDGLIFIN